MKKLLTTALLGVSIASAVAQSYTPTVYGNLIWNDKFVDQYDSRMGVYSFPASASGIKMTPLATSVNFYANGNGIMDGKNYYFVLNDTYDGEVYYQIYHYDMETWKIVGQPLEARLTDCANDFAYNRKTGKYYGLNVTSNGNGTQLCNIDFAANNRIVLADLPEDSIFYTLAAADDGTLYSITSNGNLVTIDEEGNIVNKGSLGLASQNLKLYQRVQSATFDEKTGLMYWAAQLWDSKNSDIVSALYTVDVKTLELTKVADFPDHAQIVSLYVVPPAAADEAPAAPDNLSKQFNAYELSGNVNFKAPSKTYAGQNLSGTLSYVVSEGTDTLAKGITQPGEQVSAPVTVAKEGMKRFEITVNNAAGSGAPAVLRTYIGHDKPAIAKNAKMTIVDGKAHIEWDAPDSMMNKGYYNADSLRYNVIRYSSATTTRTVAQNLNTTSTDVDLPVNRWAKYHFTIVAVNGTQQSDEASTNDMAYGPVKEITSDNPYNQSFTGSTSFNEFTAIDANGDKQVISYPDFNIEFNYGFWDYSSQRKASVYRPSNDDGNADDWLLTPLFNLKGNTYYKLQFNAWREVSRYNEQMSVGFGNYYDYSNFTTIMQTFNPDTIANGETTTYTVLFKPEKDLVGNVGFHVTSRNFQGLLYLTNIKISLATDEDITGINYISVGTKNKDNNIYDLSGRIVRRAGQSPKGLCSGIYISGGKKFVVK